MAERPDAPRARCLCLDIETARQDQTALRELGVFRPDLDARLRIPGKARDLAVRLDALTEGAAFVLGHNVVAFDQPALARLHPGLALHRLVKDYKLCTTNVRYIRQFEADYQARRFSLVENYRSTADADPQRRRPHTANRDLPRRGQPLDSGDRG